MKRIKGNTLCNLIGIICLTLGAGVLFRTAALFASNDIWFDELFTVEFTIRPISQMLPLAMKDVHPPFYYIYTRLIYVLLQGIGITDNAVKAVKIASIIPYLGILVYLVTFFRKRFGLLSAGLAFVFILTMPQLPAYISEARMYSLAMFLICAMFIHAMEMTDCEGRIRGYIHLAATSIYGIAAMYTHYYAFIAAGSIWACVYILFLIKVLRKDINEVKKHRFTKGIHPDISIITACVAVSLIAYVPWMSAVLSQVGAVSQNYWIQPVTLRTLAGCVKFIFKPEFESGLFNILAAVVLFALYVVMIVRFLYNSFGNKKTFELRFVFFALTVFVLLILAGFVASVIIRPVFVYRYMLPVMGLFWMCFAISLGNFVGAALEKKDIPQLICVILTTVLLFAVCLRDYHMFIWEEEKKCVGMLACNIAFGEIADNYDEAVLVCNFNQVQDILWFYLENDSVLWGETNETLIGDICGRAPIRMTTDISELKTMTEASKVGGETGFLFVGSGNARDEIIDIWEADGMKVEQIADSCLVERYYFNIYKVVW